MIIQGGVGMVQPSCVCSLDRSLATCPLDGLSETEQVEVDRRQTDIF